MVSIMISVRENLIRSLVSSYYPLTSNYIMIRYNHIKKAIKKTVHTSLVVKIKDKEVIFKKLLDDMMFTIYESPKDKHYNKVFVIIEKDQKKAILIPLRVDTSFDKKSFGDFIVCDCRFLILVSTKLCIENKKKFKINKIEFRENSYLDIYGKYKFTVSAITTAEDGECFYTQLGYSFRRCPNNYNKKLEHYRELRVKDLKFSYHLFT